MRREAGFTLLEVLVTLTIMAVGVALTLSLISGSLGKIRKVRTQAILIEHAQAAMEDALLNDQIVGATVLNGDFEDGTRFTVTISEVEMPPPNTPVPIAQLGAMRPPIVLSYVVDVMALDSTKTDIQLQTLKLVNPPIVGQLSGPMREPR